MPHTEFVFSTLGIIVQGIPLSRYRRDDGDLQRIVNIGDLENLYVESNLEEVPLVVPSFERYQLQKNDLVIAVRGTLLKSSVVTKTVEGSIAGQNVVFFRPNNLNQVNPVYLAVLLRSKWFQQSLDVLQRRSSTTLRAIRVSDVRTLKIPLPELEIQDQIVRLSLLAEQYTKQVIETLKVRQELTESVLYKILER